MGEVASLFVKISADTNNAINQLNGFDDKFKQVGINVAKIGIGMTATLTAPLVAIGTKAFGMASDFEESLNKVTVSFGDNANEIMKWSETTLDSFGIAQGTALEMSSLFGDMGTGMGLTTKEASKMSSGMVGLAGDLASFKNVKIDIAQTALAGIFTGETESLKKLGIVMTEANLEQFALSQGIEKSVNEMTQAEKVQLRYAYVTAMSKNAVGDFARTSDSSANQVRILQESTKELVTELGKELLPIITPIIKDIVSLVKKFASMDDGTKKLIVQIGLFLAVAGPVITVIGGIISVVGIVIGWLGGFVSIISTLTGFLIVGIGQVIAFGTFIAGLLSPIGWVILAIGAIIGILAFLNFDSIVEGAKNAWKWIVETFNNIVGFIGNIDWGQLGRDVINGIWQGMVDIWNGLWGWVSGIGQDITNAILGKQKEIDNFNNRASIYTGKKEIPPPVTKIVPKAIYQNKDKLAKYSSINWNADGGIFSKPTIFNTPNGLQGVGEREPEAIMPLSKLDSMLSKKDIDYDRLAVSVAREMGNISIVLDDDKVGTFVDRRIIKGAI